MLIGVGGIGFGEGKGGTVIAFCHSMSVYKFTIGFCWARVHDSYFYAVEPLLKNIKIKNNSFSSREINCGHVSRTFQIKVKAFYFF